MEMMLFYPTKIKVWQAVLPMLSEILTLQSLMWDITVRKNFARGHRFGFFPAGAIGWLVSNEKWFEPVTKVVDVLN